MRKANHVRVAKSEGEGRSPWIRPIMGALALVLAAACAPRVSAQEPAAAAGRGAVILMYHRFGEDAYPSTNIRLGQFEAHLDELAKGGYEVRPLTEIVRALADGTPLADRTVAITIDDAYLSVYREAWPRLRALSLPFTLFVATDQVGRDPNHMTWDQVRELSAAGVTIGHHSASHLHMPEAAPERIADDLRRANETFEKELGEAPALFAYPYGEMSLAVRRIVRAQRFDAAFGQHSGGLDRGADRFFLPRFALNEAYGDIARFRLVVNVLPLPVSEVTPAERYLADGANPPAFGFTVAEGIEGLGVLACYASHQPDALDLRRLPSRRIEIRMDAAFPPGRGRINCTLPASGGRWRWYGTQFTIP